MGANLDPPRKRAVFGWAIYDLANSIFFITVNALYFPLWVTEDLKGSDGNLALSLSLATALATIASPLLGAVSDRVGRRMYFLAATTILAVIPTSFLGVRSLPLSLTFFAIANFFFQSGVVFYDALLPEVSTEDNRGRVGSLGISFGFLGTFFGIGVGIVVASLVSEASARPVTFVVTAALFLLFALPCFLFVRESAPVARRSSRPLRDALAQLRQTIRRTNAFRPIRRFLFARFFYTNAISTLPLFITIYVTQELGLTQRQAEFLLLFGILAPIIGAFIGGRLVDRWGPKQTLAASLALWVVALSVTASLPLLASDRWTIWAASALTGLALGGTFASDRPLLLQLSPPEYVGEFFGLHNMAGRFSAIVGPLLWTGVAETLGLGRPAAVASLGGMTLIAFFIARGLPERLSGDPTGTSPPLPARGS